MNKNIGKSNDKTEKSRDDEENSKTLGKTLICTEVVLKTKECQNIMTKHNKIRLKKGINDRFCRQKKSEIEEEKIQFNRKNETDGHFGHVVRKIRIFDVPKQFMRSLNKIRSHSNQLKSWNQINKLNIRAKMKLSAPNKDEARPNIVITQPKHDATPKFTQPCGPCGKTAAGNGNQLISNSATRPSPKATCETSSTNSQGSNNLTNLLTYFTSLNNSLDKKMSDKGTNQANQVKIKDERACGRPVFIITIYATKTNPAPDVKYFLPNEDDTLSGFEIFLYGKKEIGGLELPSACRDGSATSIRDVSEPMSVAKFGWNTKALRQGGRKFCIKYHIDGNNKAVVVASINNQILSNGYSPILKLPKDCQEDEIDDQEWTYELLTSKTKLNPTQKWTSLKNENIKKIHDVFDLDGSKTIKAALRKTGFTVTSNVMPGYTYSLASRGAHNFTVIFYSTTFPDFGNKTRSKPRRVPVEVVYTDPISRRTVTDTVTLVFVAIKKREDDEEDKERKCTYCKSLIHFSRDCERRYQNANNYFSEYSKRIDEDEDSRRAPKHNVWDKGNKTNKPPVMATYLANTSATPVQAATRAKDDVEGAKERRIQLKELADESNIDTIKAKLTEMIAKHDELLATPGWEHGKGTPVATTEPEAAANADANFTRTALEKKLRSGFIFGDAIPDKLLIQIDKVLFKKKKKIIKGNDEEAEEEGKEDEEPTDDDYDYTYILNDEEHGRPLFNEHSVGRSWTKLCGEDFGISTAKDCNHDGNRLFGTPAWRYGDPNEPSKQILYVHKTPKAHGCINLATLQGISWKSMEATGVSRLDLADILLTEQVGNLATIFNNDEKFRGLFQLLGLPKSVTIKWRSRKESQSKTQETNNRMLYEARAAVAVLHVIEYYCGLYPNDVASEEWVQKNSRRFDIKNNKKNDASKNQK